MISKVIPKGLHGNMWFDLSHSKTTAFTNVLVGKKKEFVKVTRAINSANHLKLQLEIEKAICQAV